MFKILVGNNECSIQVKNSNLLFFLRKICIIKLMKQSSFFFSFMKSPIPGLPDIIKNEVITTVYKDPKYDEDFTFLAKRLPNAVDPPQVIQSDNNKNGPVIGNAHKNSYFILFKTVFEEETKSIILHIGC